tara:strand:- start:545 stop:1258 length:714 start_codon:yes stop_codon:yes gene_type:complete
MKFEILEKNIWKFKPTTNKWGYSKYKNDVKEILKIDTDIFNTKCIITSDLHSHSIELFERLNDKINLKNYIVIIAGDMAGNYIRGSDGNPTEFYNLLLKKYHVKDLIIIQGNHDLPPNKDNICSNKIIKNGYIYNHNNLGKFAGVNGIISNKLHPYKLPKFKYLGFLTKYVGRKLDILITHDTPKFGDNIGNSNIYDLVLKIKPKIYIYGHCHHKDIHTIHNKIHFFNVDGRVLICN